MRLRSLSTRLLAAVLLLAFGFLPLAAAGAEAEAGDITGECNLVLSNKHASSETLTDGSTETALPLGARDSLRIRWSSWLSAQGLYFSWKKLPREYEIEQFDYKETSLSTAVYADGMPQEYIPIDPACCIVELRMHGKGVLSELCLCKADAPLPARVHNWQLPAEQVDLMLVAAAPGDESAVFSGLLEFCTLELKRPSALVYLYKPDDARLNSALDALWAAGVRSRPVVGTHGQKNSDLITALTGGASREEYATAFVTELLRRYRPAVLVSHAPGDGDGDAARAEAYRAVRQAAALAGGAENFPETASVYGVWQPSKLYLNDPEGATVSVSGVAYGLVSSTVGADSGQNDLFENIGTDTRAGEPAPSGTPMPELPAQPYAAPTATLEPAPEPDSIQFERTANRAWLVLCALLFIILALVILLIVRVALEWRKKGVPGAGKSKRNGEEKDTHDR